MQSLSLATAWGASLFFFQNESSAVDSKEKKKASSSNRCLSYNLKTANTHVKREKEREREDKDKKYYEHSISGTTCLKNTADPSTFPLFFSLFF